MADAGEITEYVAGRLVVSDVGDAPVDTTVNASISNPGGATVTVVVDALIPDPSDVASLICGCSLVAEPAQVGLQVAGSRLGGKLSTLFRGKRDLSDPSVARGDGFLGIPQILWDGQHAEMANGQRGRLHPIDVVLGKSVIAGHGRASARWQ